MSGQRKSLKHCAVLPQKLSPQLDHQSHRTEETRKQGQYFRVRMHFLPSVIIDINALYAHAHMVPHNATAFILARTRRLIVLQLKCVWFLRISHRDSQKVDLTFPYLESTSVRSIR